MRQLLGLATICLVVLAAGLVRAQPVEPNLALSVWRPHGDALEHLQSGLECPEQLAGYRRSNAHVYDGFGLDVSCSYRAREDLITVYLTRRDGGDVASAYAGAKAQLLQIGAARHPQLISESHEPKAGLDWNVVLYAEDNGIHTGIWMADLDGWTLLYRATYAAGGEARLLADLETISTHVRKTAGAHLDLCAKSSAPKRDGRLVKTGKTAGLMSSLMAGTTVLATADGGEQPAAPPIWCAEEARVLNGRGALAWRGVDPQGADALADRVSAATIDKPPILIATPDPAALVATGRSKARWLATLQDGDQTLIFGGFGGRPTTDVMVDLLDRIETGKAQPVGGYSTSGKDLKITVSP